MTKTIHGKIHGKTIELDEDPGVADGLEVEVQMTVIPPLSTQEAPMTEGLAKIYDILGRRHSSGYKDTAERHNEHQP